MLKIQRGDLYVKMQGRLTLLGDDSLSVVIIIDVLLHGGPSILSTSSFN